jgi:hypothetical protein
VAPSLVILAAGLGRRFGGDKQMAQVGPSGETLLDYAVFDAVRAGFGRAVFVIRQDLVGDFTQGTTRRYRDAIEVRFAVQYLEDVPVGTSALKGRRTPWGTGHAVLTAEPQLTEPFAVVNADDFYGAGAYTALAGALANGRHWAVVGYPLAQTLSPAGAVNRARLVSDSKGFVTDVQELRGIGPEGEGLAPDTPVSMNAWGFTQALFPWLHGEFARFLDALPGPEDEFLLPEAVREGIKVEAGRVQLLQPSGRWTGITHPDDMPRVREFLAELAREGRYPAKLW